LEAGEVRPEQGSDGHGLLWSAADRLDDCRHWTKRRKQPYRGKRPLQPADGHTGPQCSAGTGCEPQCHAGAGRDQCQRRHACRDGNWDANWIGRWHRNWFRVERTDFWRSGYHRLLAQQPRQSILVYKKKNHYNEWEFVYDPIAEQTMQAGATACRRNHNSSNRNNNSSNNSNSNSNSNNKSRFLSLALYHPNAKRLVPARGQALWWSKTN